MECFIRVRVLRWQDWDGFFNREYRPLLTDCASVTHIKLYRDVEDPSVFGYMLKYENSRSFFSTIESESFCEIFGSQGSAWEIMSQDHQVHSLPI